MRSDRDEPEMTKRLTGALAERLLAVVIYGPAVHDDAYPALGGEHLLIVVADLEPATLRQLADPIHWWLGKGRPWPRVFSRELLRASADVFPIELLDLTTHRRVVFGDDPLTAIPIDREHLRLQLERELREKLMRLREGYIESRTRWRRRRLEELLAVSYASFVRLFRACLHVIGAPAARGDRDVVVALCARLDLPTAAFDAVDRIARGEHAADSEAVFAAYYRALTAAEARIDRLIIHPPGRAP